MSEYFYTKKEAEKAILVGVALQSENISYDTMCEYLDELAFLAETAGAETVKIFTQNLDKPVTATFVGKGKLEEIKNYVEENDIDLIIFDDELSPTQLRNIERELTRRKMKKNGSTWKCARATAWRESFSAVERSAWKSLPD